MKNVRAYYTLNPVEHVPKLRNHSRHNRFAEIDVESR